MPSPPRREEDGVRNLRFLVAYDGTEFRGWQRQDTGPTIQAELESAFVTITRRPPSEVSLAGSGRTDAGVHASGQVASLLTRATDLDLRLLRRGMNAVLPEGIVVRAVEPAPIDFHARFSARGKVYRYRVLQAPHPSPAPRRQVHWVRHRLDVDSMVASAASLTGTHDFAAYTTQAARIHDTVRRLQRLDIEQQGDELRLTFQASGFLYNMVRALTGTLLEVGGGRRPISDPYAILLAGKRAGAGDNAPPGGLSMLHVIYDEELTWAL